MKVKETTNGSDRYSRDCIYYLDGRGESNKGFTHGFLYETKTILKKRKLVMEMTIRFPNRKENSFQIEEWVLSKDGRSLTVTVENFGRKEDRGFSFGLLRYDKIFKLVS